MTLQGTNEEGERILRRIRARPKKHRIEQWLKENMVNLGKISPHFIKVWETTNRSDTFLDDMDGLVYFKPDYGWWWNSEGEVSKGEIIYVHFEHEDDLVRFKLSVNMRSA